MWPQTSLSSAWIAGRRSFEPSRSPAWPTQTNCRPLTGRKMTSLRRSLSFLRRSARRKRGTKYGECFLLEWAAAETDVSCSSLHQQVDLSLLQRSVAQRHLLDETDRTRLKLNTNTISEWLLMSMCGVFFLFKTWVGYFCFGVISIVLDVSNFFSYFMFKISSTNTTFEIFMTTCSNYLRSK